VAGRRRGWLLGIAVAAAASLGLGRSVLAATTRIVLAEILGSWQGDDAVQFVELAITTDGATNVAGGTLTFAGASGEKQSFSLPTDVMNGAAGARILLETTRGAQVTGVPSDFVLPDGLLAPRTGRVCYQVSDLMTGAHVVDCLAYGGYPGDNGAFGKPTTLTPDDRSLQRIAIGGDSQTDWRASLRPAPENNAAAMAILPTLCGDGHIDAGEECDGSSLAGKTCASMGFAKGTLACTQCHFDTSGCTGCGNGTINPGEQCDGTDFGGRSCAALGFTGGTLRCTSRCTLDTAGCDPTFYVPGGGPLAPECLAEWRIANPAGRPGRNGKGPALQRCRDGDPGCDTDTVPGRCTFTVAVCFDHDDPRFARGGTPCRRPPIASWTLLGPSASGDSANALVAAVAALGPSTVSGATVTFVPALDGTEHCTDPVDVPVAQKHRLAIRARTSGAGGTPRDIDVLKLSCVP
jgi:hypothetical protein